MPDLIPHIATLRCIINTADEVEAVLAADKLKAVCEDYLDEEDGDEVVVTQVTSMTTAVEPSETLVILRRARNALIRTRIRDCFDMAREFDKMIYALDHRSDGEHALAGYDYGHLLEVADQILTYGKDPV
jgi:hypothetical protein